MQRGSVITEDADIKRILESAKTIAIVGVSPKPERDSYQVAAYLKKMGYRIVPVRPAQTEILGETAYPTLDAVSTATDIVDVFRRSDQIIPHVQEALRMRPKVFWMQEGIENREAAAMLTSAGIDVVMNRCIKRSHEKLFGSIGL
jgi:predicted CoA-binding protein